MGANVVARIRFFL